MMYQTIYLYAPFFTLRCSGFIFSNHVITDFAKYFSLILMIEINNVLKKDMSEEKTHKVNAFSVDITHSRHICVSNTQPTYLC